MSNLKTGSELVEGQCYEFMRRNYITMSPSNTGTITPVYMGRFRRFARLGRIFDPEEVYTFENGDIADGLSHWNERDFNLVECRERGGARRIRVTRKRSSSVRRRKHRKTR